MEDHSPVYRYCPDCHPRQHGTSELSVEGAYPQPLPKGKGRGLPLTPPNGRGRQALYILGTIALCLTLLA